MPVPLLKLAQGSPDNIHPLVRSLKEFDIDVIYEQLGSLVMLAATHTKGEPQARLGQLLKQADLHKFLRRAFEALGDRANQQQVDTGEDGRLHIDCLSLKSRLSEPEIQRAAELLFLAGHSARAAAEAAAIYRAQNDADFFGCASLDARQRQIRESQEENQRLESYIRVLNQAEAVLVCPHALIKGLGEEVLNIVKGIGQVFTMNPLDLVKAMVGSFTELAEAVLRGDLKDIAEQLAPKLMAVFTKWQQSKEADRCRLIGEAIPEIIELITAAFAGVKVASTASRLPGALAKLPRTGLSPQKIMTETLKAGARKLAEPVKAGARRVRNAGEAVRAGIHKADDLLTGRSGRATPDGGKLPDGGQKPLSAEVKAQLEGGAQLVEIDGLPYVRSKDGRLWKCSSPCEAVTSPGVPGGRLAGTLVEQLDLPVEAQRALLRQATGQAGTGKVAHHIIPLEAIAEHRELLENAAKGGFNINGSGNGILLRRVDHIGGHPIYNRALLDELARIPKNLSPEKTARALEDVAEIMRSSIVRGDYGPWG